MKKPTLLPLLISILCCFSFLTISHGQDSGLKKAENQIYKGKIEKAKHIYHKALSKDSLNYKANFGLGAMFYNYFQEFDSAYFYMNRAIENKEDTVHLDFLTYGHSQRLTNRFTDAIQSYEVFRSHAAEKYSSEKIQIDSIIDAHINYCNQAIFLSNNYAAEITVENMDFFINTKESEYTSVYYSQDSVMLFNARYKDITKEKMYADFQYMENIYVFDLSEGIASTYDESIKQESHQAVVSNIPGSDSVVVFFQNKLWISLIENGRLTELQAFPENLSNFYFQPHGVFNSNQNVFIYSAKNELTDDLDLYISHKNNDGSWGESKKMSDNINTEFDEDSPFLTLNDSVLYFSSKGHNSSGGYDIFKSELTEDGWSKAEQLPYPLNSTAEDIYFVLSEDGNYGYLSSNRAGGLGMMDIYTVYLKPVPTFECEQYDNPEFVVTFDIRESIDTSSVELAHDWIFEDGTQLTGELVEKEFASPGKHNVYINIHDVDGGQTEYQEVHETVEIDSVNFVGFYSKVNYALGDTILLDASVTFIEGYEFYNYFWAINDSILNIDNSHLTLHDLPIGDYAISLQVYGDNGDGLNSFCSTDSIHVKKSVITIGEPLLGDTSVFVQNNSIDSSNTMDNSNQFADSTFFADNQTTSIEFEPIYFDFDQFNLKKEAIGKLGRLIDFMKANPEYVVIIAGHADGMGADDYNVELSAKRTKATIAYIIENGISENRIYKVYNRGESEPVEPNTNDNGSDNIEGRKKNRRVEFKILKPK